MSTVRHKSYRVHFTAAERQSLRRLIDSGKSSAQSRRRTTILLSVDDSLLHGDLRDVRIAECLGMGMAAVERVRKQCVLEVPVVSHYYANISK